MTGPVNRLETDPAGWWAGHWKASLAFLGSLTPGAVFAVLDAVGVVHTDPRIQAAVTVLCAVLAVAFGPKNKA